MKKIMFVLTLLLGTITFSFAQSKMAADTSAKSKKNAAKAAKTVKDAKTTTSSTGVNKDGSPDMRLKANKDAKAKQPAAATTTQSAPVPAAKASQPAQVKPAVATTSSDKVMGKDAKGRTIYQGPKNGQYIINANGNKEYIKKN